eukprot:COSAG06_NODE_11114_length_1565_cov_1.074352_2_plen_83_part_00
MQTGKARQARRGKARQGKARQGKARQGKKDRLPSHGAAADFAHRFRLRLRGRLRNIPSIRVCNALCINVLSIRVCVPYIYEH